MSNLYAERDIVAQGDHYSKHVSAMTSEGLHSKSDIAAELAHRDIQLEQAEARIAEYEALTDEMDKATRRCYLSGPTVVNRFKSLQPPQEGSGDE